MLKHDSAQANSVNMGSANQNSSDSTNLEETKSTTLFTAPTVVIGKNKKVNAHKTAPTEIKEKPAPVLNRNTDPLEQTQ